MTQHGGPARRGQSPRADRSAADGAAWPLGRGRRSAGRTRRRRETLVRPPVPERTGAVCTLRGRAAPRASVRPRETPLRTRGRRGAPGPSAGASSPRRRGLRRSPARPFPKLARAGRALRDTKAGASALLRADPARGRRAKAREPPGSRRVCGPGVAHAREPGTTCPGRGFAAPAEPDPPHAEPLLAASSRGPAPAERGGGTRAPTGRSERRSLPRPPTPAPGLTPDPARLRAAALREACPQPGRRSGSPGAPQRPARRPRAPPASRPPPAPPPHPAGSPPAVRGSRSATWRRAAGGGRRAGGFAAPTRGPRTRGRSADQPDRLTRRRTHDG